MTIIVFLVDTSASMNQRTYLGTSLLDVAKWAVENFMKIRSRDPASRLDRYMLLTFEDPPANIKAGWKESHATFTSELKNLQATGLTMMGPALKYTFDLLNVNRMQSGIDTYGQGRFPFYLEPAVIVCITDGRKLTSSGAVQSELNLPMNTNVPGSELTKEPFRWDQRLFGLALRLPATPPTENQTQFVPNADDSPIDVMCEVTGGRSYAVSSQRMLNQCLESLVQKVQAGVVINFEKMGPDPPPVDGAKADADSSSKENQDSNCQDSLLGIHPDDKMRVPTPTPTNTAWHSCRKLIYVQRSAQKGYSVGFWPIPEAFWPNADTSLPPRLSHPVIKFSCSPADPMILENVPFDKYELEPSPLTQYILERRQPNVAWQVFVSSSGRYPNICHPFGYLKASTNLTTVNLVVMPYNFPVLLPLLDELFKLHKFKPTQEWRHSFDSYLNSMPVYYAQPLKRALGRLGISNLIPDNLENCLSYNVVSYLKKLKNQAKIEHERLVQSVGQKGAPPETIKVTPKSQSSLLLRKDFNQLIQQYNGDISHLKQELNEYNSFSLAVPDSGLKHQTYRNPFDIPRKTLLDQVMRMRANFLHTSTMGTRLQDEDERHRIPVQQMGNYQDHLKKQQPPLRELETQPMRSHMFGNPFKVNKNLMIDEADEAMPGQQVQSRKRAHSHSEMPPASPGPRAKRKPGPLPKDMPYRRPSTPPPMEPLQIVVNDSDSESELEINESDSPESTPPSEESPINENHVDEEDVSVPVSNHVEESNNNIDAEEHVERVVDNGIPPNGKLNGKKQALVREHNNKLREIAIREVKRPGKNFKPLFSCLEQLKGGADIKCLLIRDIMREATRFKRKGLVQLLEHFEQDLLRTGLKKSKGLPITNNKSPSR